MSRKASGFSFLELMVVVAVVVILAGVTIPSILNTLQNYRGADDTRSIATQLALARMRAASDFTRTELSFSLTANTYELEVWNKTTSAYQLEGTVLSLSQGVTFGFGSITTPAGGQTTIAQTSQIYFNSRGISVDGSGNPIGTAVIYLTNGAGEFWAVTVSINGTVRAFEYTKGAWNAL
jgi:prepilin-type N-terminal cleavage/methylation domain-containing protein